MRIVLALLATLCACPALAQNVFVHGHVTSVTGREFKVHQNKGPDLMTIDASGISDPIPPVGTLVVVLGTPAGGHLTALKIEVGPHATLGIGIGR